MKKLLLALAIFTCTGAVFTSVIAKDPDCGCKKDEIKTEEQTKEVEKDPDCGCREIEEEKC